MNVKSWELREGGRTGRAMQCGESRGNLGAAGVWNGIRGDEARRFDMRVRRVVKL